MEEKLNFPLLTSEDIEVKVKQVTKTGALLLLYKTSRTDAKILDETVGAMRWECDYKTVKDVLYCGIGIANDAGKIVWKWDSGIESGQDDGNEKKAESSDAFKRAASKWGIGRELYTSPQIWADVATKQKGDKWYLEDPFAKYVVTKIEYNKETRVITSLEITNVKSNIVVYSWSMSNSGAMAKKMVKTLDSSDKVVDVVDDPLPAAFNEPAPAKPAKKAPEAPKEAPTAPKAAETAKSSTEERIPLKTLITAIGKMVKGMMGKEGSAASYNAIVAKVTGGAAFKCNAATEEQYDTVAAIYKELVAAGYGE